MERERCRIEEVRPPPAGPDEPLVVSGVVPGLLKRLGLEERHWLDTLVQEWKEVVGEAVAAHARPGRLERKHLVVFVDSSVWLNELVRYGRSQLLSNLQKRYGADRIGSVSLQLDPDGARPL